MIESAEDLVKFYKKDSKVQSEVFSKKQHRKVAPDDFYAWVLKRGICPYGIISSNTKYWLKLMSIYDSDSGLNTPLPYQELPATFFEVLEIYRANRPEVKEPDG